MLPCYVLIIGVRNAGRDSMATTVWLALTLWLVMMIGELGIVTQSVTSLASNIEVERCHVAGLSGQAMGGCLVNPAELAT